MTTDAVPLTGQAPTTPRTITVPRHKLLVRITHWLNVIALTLMLMTGLDIFNAHPALYWGNHSDFAHPWLALTADYDTHRHIEGITQLGDTKFVTTGLLGASRQDGQITGRGFPSWMTLPHAVYLSDARTWHFFWAWVFALNGAIYLVTGLIGRHLTRDIVPGWRDIVFFWKDPHLRLKFEKGWSSLRYHSMQRIAYASIALIILPLIVLTGMTMSPGLDAAFPFLPAVFGGRQSARSIHFICAWLAVGFILVHVLMVIASGPINQLRGMITGKVRIVDDTLVHDRERAQ